MSKKLRYALFGYHPHQSFGQGGHAAYWDGWYDSIEGPRRVFPNVQKEYPRLKFMIVEHLEDLVEEA